MNQTRAAAASPAGAEVRFRPVGYWQHAVWFGLALLLVVAVRLHEFVPLTRLLKPVLSVSVVGAAVVFSRTARPLLLRVLKDPLSKAVIAYFLWVIATIPFSIWKGQSLNVAQSLLPSTLMFLVLSLCVPNQEIARKVQLGFIAFIALYGLRVLTSAWIVAGRAMVGGTYDPNDMASMLAVGLLISIGTLIRPAFGKWRIAVAAAMPVIALALVASGSRGGIVGLAVGTLVLIAGLHGPKRLATIAFVVVGAVVAWNRASPDFRNRMTTLLNLEEDYNFHAETGRKALVKRGIQYYLDRPIVGVGAGNFQQREGLWRASEGLTGRWAAPHNSYVQAFVEGGTFGGVLFLTIIGLSAVRAGRVWRARKRRPEDLHQPEWLAAIASWAVAATFLSHAYYPMLFALAGITTLLRKAAEHETAQPAATPVAPRVKRGERGGLALGRMTGSLRGGLASPAQRVMLSARREPDAHGRRGGGF